MLFPKQKVNIESMVQDLTCGRRGGKFYSS